MELTIYRQDFRDHSDRPGVSMFEDVLRQLRVDECGMDHIDEMTIQVDSFETSD